MNEKKEGRKYRYPDSLILVIGYIRVYLHLPYRQTEGTIKATGKNLSSHPLVIHKSTEGYTTLTLIVVEAVVNWMGIKMISS